MTKAVIIIPQIINHACDQTGSEKLMNIAQNLNIGLIDILSISVPAGAIGLQLAPATLALLTDYSVIIAADDEISNLLLAQIAVFLNASIVGKVMEFIDSDTVLIKKYTAKVQATVTNKNRHKIYSVDLSAFTGRFSLQLAHATIPVSADSGAVLSIKKNPQPSHYSDNNQNSEDTLKTAKRIVAGGIALRDATNFNNLIVALAHKMQAAYAGSLIAAEQKLLPFQLHIGQTGVTVAPELYLAVGISGAPQHLIGIFGAKTIIALNNDPDAPIFAYADYGLVADLFEIIPRLLQDL